MLYPNSRMLNRDHSTKPPLLHGTAAMTQQMRRAICSSNLKIPEPAAHIVFVQTKLMNFARAALSRTAQLYNGLDVLEHMLLHSLAR